MSIDGPGRELLREVAEALKEAGEEGKGLRRNLRAQINEAAKPIAKKVADPANLKKHLPDRYAAVLAEDLYVAILKSFSGNPRVQISARTRGEHRRKVRLLDSGFINHPKWPDHRPRSEWKWRNYQTGGMEPGFFTGPCEEATPDVRERVIRALAETKKQVIGG